MHIDATEFRLRGGDEVDTDSPWFIVQADDKKYARLIASQIVLDALQGLWWSYPEVTAARRQELKAIQKSWRKEQQAGAPTQ